MTRPGTFYDALRALRAAPPSGLDPHRLHEQTEQAILAALGWPAPGPAVDDRGKPVKVWSLDVRYVLPEALRDEAADAARAAGARYGAVIGLVAAPTKAAAIRLAGWNPGGQRKALTRTSDLREVEPTDLRYPLAAEHRDQAVIVDLADGLTPVPLRDLRATVYSREVRP